jgi:hypothetical protein
MGGVVVLDQTLINWVFGLCGVLIGWLFKMMWQSLRDLQTADASLVLKVQAIEVLVAGQYVKRDDMDRLQTALFQKLDRIEQKLDGKVDK